MSFEEYYLPLINATDCEKEFAVYCMKKICDIIDQRDSTDLWTITDVIFEECPIAKNLNYKCIDAIYNLIRSYWFNEHDISVTFSNLSDGSKIIIYYLINRVVFCRYPKYKDDVIVLLKYCLYLIEKHSNYPIIIPIGQKNHCRHSVYFEVKQYLLKTSEYTLCLNFNQEWELRNI